ncbi:hypothetical protein AB0M41_32110 [Streptomyces sp. NPDC051896]|uniref:hypothetical protein n=1 Tax=Streptomyces sp. NPDC051896 TaxID=3155416 RepID=UPI003426445B
MRAQGGRTRSLRGETPQFLAFALLNRVFDVVVGLPACAALAIGVPWYSLRLAHVLTRIPGSLRLTPGSLGIVETSLSALLVLYGLRPGPAIAPTRQPTGNER